MRTDHTGTDERDEQVTPATRSRQPSDGVSPADGIAAELELADWRREVSELYAAVRSTATPRDAHALWRERRDRLFRDHPQSPLPAGSRLRRAGLPYWPYDPRLRVEVAVQAAVAPVRLALPTGDGDTTYLRQVGSVQLPPHGEERVNIWWLDQYGGGIFIPIRDRTAGQESYGGGRYLLDTAKGADLGASGGRLIVDLNFLYHPSCRYDDRWVCPLAPAGNVVDAALRAGEKL
jgi:uncharacterized protein